MGGALFALGRLTPLASAAITGTMVTAIRKAHASNGPWATDGGYEYNAVLIASVFGVTERENGLGWALAQLAAGTAGSFLATSAALAQPQEQPAATDDRAADAEPRFHRDDANAAAMRPSDVAAPGRS